MPATPRRAGLAAAAALALSLPTRASAQNTDSFFFSDEAAMSAGAVTATTRDSGAIWYNPAGLGGLQRGQIDLSASAFGLRVRRVPRALTLSYPGGPQSLDISTTSFISAPVAVGLSRHLSDTVTVGLGIYATARDVVTTDAFWRGRQSVALGGVDTPLQFHQRLEQDGDYSRYHVGPAIGWQAAPRLRVGLSVLGTYGVLASFEQFVVEGQPTVEPPTYEPAYFLQSQVRAKLSYLGLQPQVGLQYEVSDRLRVGLLVRSPELLLTGTIRASTVTAVRQPDPAGQPGPLLTQTGPVRRSYSFEFVQPPRVVLSVAWGHPKDGFVALEGDYQAPLKNDEVFVDRATVLNARVGGLRHLGQRFSLGAGLFTERATDRRLDRTTFLAERVDYYGATFGVQLRTPLALVKNPQEDALVLSTTVALRYALGLGKVTGLTLDPIGGAPEAYRAIDVVYHEFIPYLGSSTNF
ncbi:MAG TPA: hypothetical protein VFS43_41310 [Polyangiaceae bacterium]|nr:hypothetical protein [Polyangiaceae bacterium]